MASGPSDVFVSYNRADRDWAEWIAWTLEAAGRPVLFQDWDFRPGSNFALRMQDGARARYTVAVLSSSYLEAEYTQAEWAAAFARDPQGKNRSLIPFRVRECQPDGILGPIVYADLIGLDEGAARQAVLNAFLDRAKPETEPAFPGTRRGLGDLVLRPKPAFPGGGSAVQLSLNLPQTGEHFFGREEDLARLDAAWAAPAVHALSVVAWGGVGKTALVKHWLANLERDGWRGAERVLAWTFYSRGSGEDRNASSEPFFSAAFRWLGEEPPLAPRDRGLKLAELLRARRTLLVLDGVEPLQHPPGAAQEGRLRDSALAALVRDLALANPGLCLLTTREKVADLADLANGSAPRLELEALSPTTAVRLLRELGVKGAERDLRRVAEAFGGHALALTLLGHYLRRARGGNVNAAFEVELGKADERQGGHAFRVMAAYETWLPPRELAALRLVGLFDRAAPGAAVKALRSPPAIPGLTEELVGLGEEDWRWSVASLRENSLLAPEDPKDPAGLDAHPLVREHFAGRLKEAASEAWREGNLRLYEHYQKAAPEYPDTLEQMLPLYAAVVHGCRGGRVQEACVEVYWRRILRGNEHFSWRKLGAFGSELTVLAAFFDHPWDQPSQELSAEVQAWFLNQVGAALRALGRLGEAVGPMRATLEANKADQEWENAAVCASNLSEFLLTLGQVAEAVAAGEESVVLADRGDSAFDQMDHRTVLADALHGARRWEESAALFREAEGMQAERQKQYPRLYSLAGYRYCDLLLSREEPGDGAGLEGVGIEVASSSGVGAQHAAPSQRAGGRERTGDGGRAQHAAPLRGQDTTNRYRAACEEVRGRAEQSLEWEQGMHDAPILDFALHYLSLGRAWLGLALTAPSAQGFGPAAEHLDRAVEGLRQAGTEHHLPRGLLARAAFHRFTGNLAAAAVDLGEALEIAERGGMRLHEADAHLEWTRLHFQQGDLPTARTHHARARELVTACGYGRREREVLWLAGRVEE